MKGMHCILVDCADNITCKENKDPSNNSVVEELYTEYTRCLLNRYMDGWMDVGRYGSVVDKKDFQQVRVTPPTLLSGQG